MQETGVIKYNCNWIKAEAIDYPIITELNAWRDVLFKLQYIGAYDDSGIGYGNISCRLHNNTFLISGSATGHLTQLTNQHYTTVIDFDIEKNRVTIKMSN